MTENPLSVNLIVTKPVILFASPITYCVCVVVVYFIDFHCSRLKYPSQGGNIIASPLLPWKVVSQLGGGGDIPTLPLNFDQFNITGPSLGHHGSIYIV